MPDLSPQFTMFPRPKLPGSARGLHGPVPAPKVSDAMNPHGVHIRFGDWPENERSMNHAEGGHEEGVSVYDMHGSHAEPADPDPHGFRAEHDIGWQREMHIDTHGDDKDFEPDYTYTPDNDTGEEMRNRRRQSYRSATYDGNSWEDHDQQPSGLRGHFVKGDVVGSGYDSEPLLRGVRHVGAWPQDAHRFVPGTQEGLFPERLLQPKQGF